MKKSKNEKRTFDRQFWIIFILFIAFLLITLSFPYLFSHNYWFNINFSDTGQIGDTIGGILSPFIAILAAILTFLAFWVQFKANEQQKTDLKIERFENKFYELLRLHKSNINEIELNETIKGREAFIDMFYELQTAYEVCNYYYDDLKKDFSKKEIMNLSYNIFFFGIGENSEKSYYNKLNDNEKIVFEKVIHSLDLLQITYIESNKNIKVHQNNNTIPIIDTDGKEICKKEFRHLPFNGHSSKLGHYYRHLFQTINFITKQKLLSEKEKYEYVKTLRSQLSNFEQLMIYYNSVSWFEDAWKEFIVKYKILKNLPVPMADFYISPTELYQEEINNEDNIFDWG